MKILIGIDDSPCSHAAVEFVAGLPWSPGNRCVVVSVISFNPHPSHVHLRQEQRKSHEALVACAERRLRSAGLLTRTRVARGDPGDVIVRLARTEKATLVVVGSRGRSGLPKLLMGSVATHVVAHAPCSVLVARMPKRIAVRLPAKAPVENRSGS